MTELRSTRIIDCLKQRLKWAFELDHYQKAYSQEGEDMILLRLFEYQLRGFYVDVGAHHPQRFSNTYLFYRRGWTGINIDANPGSMVAFQKTRPRDINLEVAISDEEKTAMYYIFDDTALNTFDETLAQERHNNTKYSILDRKLLTSRPLAAVLDQHMPPQTPIDFMSIDVEGSDLEVLRSNDWQRYRPSVLLVESSSSGLRRIEQDPLASYLDNHHYELFAKTVNTLFFKDGDPSA